MAVQKQEMGNLPLPATLSDPQQAIRSRSWWYLVWRQLRKDRAAMLGAALLVCMVTLALAAPLLTPYDPIGQSDDPADYLAAPSREHVFGTDELRRDVFSRVIHGGLITMRVGLLSVLGAISAGIPLGVLGGFYGGWVDSLIGRLIDVLLALPGVLLAISVVAILGAQLENAMLAVAVAMTPTFARLVRSVVLIEKNKLYIEAARAVGCSDFYLIVRHILPSVISPVIVIGTLNVASAIQIAAGLSFLGLGAQPPTPEWGAMLSGGRGYIRSGEWWLTVFPGIAILLTVLSINLLGDGLRDALDPRLIE